MAQGREPRDLTDLLAEAGRGLELYGEPLSAVGEDLPESPAVLMRRFARRMALDHDAIDQAQTLDDLWDDMDVSPTVQANRQQVLTAVMAGELTWEDADDEELAEWLDVVWSPSRKLRRTVATTLVDSHMRGFVLAERLWERLPDGMMAVADLRRVHGRGYELAEDPFGKPWALQFWLSSEPPVAPSGQGISTLTGISWQTESYVINPTDNPQEWDRFVFLTSPEDCPRLAGLGAYVAAWPYWWLEGQLRQWLASGAERLGTVPVFAKLSAAQGASGLTDGQYAKQKEQVFKMLKSLQTHFRGILPAGWEVEFADTKANGMADFMLGVDRWLRERIEQAIVLQTVTGGGQAEGGTLGANVAIIEGTFASLVKDMQRRYMGMVDDLNRRMVDANWGPGRRIPKARLEGRNPAEEQARRDKLRAGIELGFIDRHEPHIREAFGAPPMDEELLAATAEARQRFQSHRLGDITQLEPAAQEPQTGVAAEVRGVLEDYEAGDIGWRAAFAMLQRLGTDDQTARDLLDEVRERHGEYEGDATDVAPEMAPAGGEEDGPAGVLDEKARKALADTLTSLADGKRTPEAAVLELQISLPGIDPGLLRDLVNAQVPAAQPATEEPAEEFSDPQAEVISAQLKRRMASFAEKLQGEYDASRPAPVTGIFRDAYRRAGGLDADRASSYAQQAREEVTAWVASELEQGTDPHSLAIQVVEYYSDPSTVREVLDRMKGGDS